MTFPLVFQFVTAIPGDGFDGWQNYWNLWWVKRALIDLGTHPYFTYYLDYPSGVSLYFHTLNIFNGLWSLPVQLSSGLIPAYNAVVLFSFVIGGYGAYLLGRYTLRNMMPQNPWPAWLAGVIFTFSPFHFAHLLGHMQVFSLEWIPFYALYLLKATTGGRRTPLREMLAPPRRRHILLAALFLVLTGLCDWYYVMYLLLFTALYLVYLTVRRRLTLVSLLATASVGMIAGFCLSPLWGPMALEASRASYMMPDPQHTLRLSADLLAFITPNEMHPLWGTAARNFSTRFTTTTSERMVFAGYVPLLLAVCALASRRSRAVSWWTLSLAFFFVLSLGPVLHVGGKVVPLDPALPDRPYMPYHWLAQVLPFMRISRSVSRFDVMVMLSVAVLAAIGLATLWERTQQRAKWPMAGLGVLVTGLVCFEFLAVPYPMSPPDTPSFYENLARDPEDHAVLNLPMDWDRPQYLLYQTVHGKRLISAYTSRSNPLSVVDKTPVLQDFRQPGPHVIQADPAEVGLSVFDAFAIRYVIIDNYQMPDPDQRARTMALVRRVFGSQPPLYTDDRLIVYQVTSDAPRQPFVRLGAGWSEREFVDGQPVRTMSDRAQVVIHAPTRGKIVLRVALHSAAARKVRLELNGTSLTSFDVGPGLSAALRIPLTVTEGDNILQFVAEPQAEPAHLPLQLRRISLVAPRP